MPRIDPVQLLKCLGVLLSPDGGIKSKDEVQRLASLMTKFSKKLVSKCIYIQILKQTGTELLGSFMSAGGWTLVHMWLSDAILAKNWPLIRELLELLLLCPVDLERLKTNNSPKLVKELSKEVDQPVIQALAGKLVEQWLKLVKDEPAPPLSLDQLPVIIEQHLNPSSVPQKRSDDRVVGKENEENSENEESDGSVDELNVARNANSEAPENSIPILKILVKDGNVVSEFSEKNDKKSSDSKKQLKSDKKISDDRNDKKDDEKKKSDSKSSSSKSGSGVSSKSKHSSKSSSGERRHSSSSSDGHSKSKEKRPVSSGSSSSNSSRKESDKNRKDKRREHEKNRDKSVDKNKEHSSKNKESSKSKETDKKDSDKSKDPTGKPKLSLVKLGKIPKKSASSESEVKKEKPSISIEVRNPNDTNRPKTVKMFNSKFRSHGLEEEVKPPPPRGTIKKPNAPAPAVPPVLSAPKRSSPTRNVEIPPEKKLKLNENGAERPGAIKLIPPKPKPTYLLESGLFMDALTASATNKKETKKRKRRISGSKENSTPGEVSPPISPNQSTVPSSPLVEESKSTPLRFYQDTLDTEEEDKEKDGNSTESTNNESNKVTAKPDTDSPMSPVMKKDDIDIDISRSGDLNLSGLKGVLNAHKRKGPKKSVQWRDSNLEEVRYFELDETERVNVNKPFRDMKQMELINEREAFKKGRNLANEDLMEERTLWRKLIPIDVDKDLLADGKNSNERIIQMNRQANVLQAIYFNKTMIPDSPAEPDLENHPVTEPTVIPPDDASGNPDNINDFQNTPWPEPKTNPPMPPNPNMPNPQMLSNMPQFNSNFNNSPYGMSGFPAGPNMIGPGMPNEWPPNASNMMMPENANMNYDMSMSMPMYNGGPGPMNDYPMMDDMNGPGYQQGYPGPMTGPNGIMSGSMNRPMNHGPPNRPGPYGYKNRGGGGFRGPPGPRTGGPMGWRSKGPGNWNGPNRPGGGGSVHRSNRICTHFQKKGFCRDGDSCQFLHSSSRSRY